MKCLGRCPVPSCLLQTALLRQLRRVPDLRLTLGPYLIHLTIRNAANYFHILLQTSMLVGRRTIERLAQENCYWLVVAASLQSTTTYAIQIR